MKQNQQRNRFLGRIALVMAMAAIAHHAQAKPLAEMPNNAGGKILLTDEKCVVQGTNYGNLNRAYGFASNGDKIEGCFAYSDAAKTIEIIWIHYGPRGPYTKETVYNAADFRLIDLPSDPTTPQRQQKAAPSKSQYPRDL